MSHLAHAAAILTVLLLACVGLLLACVGLNTNDAPPDEAPVAADTNAPVGDSAPSGEEVPLFDGRCPSVARCSEVAAEARATDLDPQAAVEAIILLSREDGCLEEALDCARREFPPAPQPEGTP